MRPDGVAAVMFSNGGSDAVEGALKLARQYHKLRGQKDRTKFIALRQGYHGVHFGGMSVNGNTNFRRAYEPLLPGVFPHRQPVAVPQPVDARHRHRGRGRTRPANGRRARARDRLPGSRHRGGLHRRADPGCGRRDRAARQFLAAGARGLRPPWCAADRRRGGDRLRPRRHPVRHPAVGGATPTCGAWPRASAAATSRWAPRPSASQVAEVFDADVSGAGQIAHGYTYSAHPVAAAAALATLKLLVERDIPGHVARVSAGLPAAPARPGRSAMPSSATCAATD
jgi:putrescine aminotransferase